MSRTETLLPVCRLSVIIPAYNRKGLTERAVASVLACNDPIGIEILVADDSSTDGTLDYLTQVFPDAVRSGKLRIETFERSMDPGKTRNRGVSRAQGSFLAFLDGKDQWRPGRLTALEPLLKHHDLILATDEPLNRSSDWITSFLATNWALTSSAVIKRTLFDEVGGFPEGYAGFPLPRRVPGMAEYEFWLKCLAKLSTEDRRERFLMIPNEHVIVEPEVLPPMVFARFKAKADTFREAVSLLSVARKLPKRYWLPLAKRLLESGKTMIKK